MAFTREALKAMNSLSDVVARIRPTKLAAFGFAGLPKQERDDLQVALDAVDEAQIAPTAIFAVLSGISVSQESSG